jgi:hypothetical protein
VSLGLLAYTLIEGGLAVLVIGLVVYGFLRSDRRYRGSAGADGFRETTEVFRDPTTGVMTRVYFNKTTGERQYRESPGQ